MSKLWCVKGNLNDGEIFLRADAVEISPHGELALYRGERFALPGPGPRAWRLDVAALPPRQTACALAVAPSF